LAQGLRVAEVEIVSSVKLAELARIYSVLSLIRYFGSGAPGAIPTRDLSLRRRALYATELREPGRVNSIQ
jgi:hypothetical protein